MNTGCPGCFSLIALLMLLAGALASPLASAPKCGIAAFALFAGTMLLASHQSKRN